MSTIGPISNTQTGMSTMMQNTSGAAASLPTQTGTSALPGASATASTGGSASSSSASSSGSSISSLSGTDTFLKLLVAQLKNQDPTSPMDNQAFVTELAQFNTVEQMLSLKQSVDSQVAAQQASEGVTMIGKTITYTVPGIGQASATTAQGQVSSVGLAGGQVQLQVNGQPVPLAQVTGVS